MADPLRGLLARVAGGSVSASSAHHEFATVLSRTGAVSASALSPVVHAVLLLPKGADQSPLEFLVDHAAHSAPAPAARASPAYGWPSDAYARCVARVALDATTASSKVVRARSCHLLALLLDRADPCGAACLFESEDELLGRVVLKLSPRFRDKSSWVREWAVRAARRLQCPRRGTRDPVCRSVLDALTLDESAEVRCAALDSIVVCAETVEHVVTRTKDVAETVRAQAYRVLSIRVRMSAIPPECRSVLLSPVMTGRSEETARQLSAVLASWLSQLEWGYVEGETLEDTLPELSIVGRLIEDSSRDQMLCYQLLKLSNVCELYDETGRRRLESVVRRVIPLVSADRKLVSLAMDVLSRLHPDKDEWTMIVVEILSDLKDPIDLDEETQSQMEAADEGRRGLPPEEQARVLVRCLNVASRLLELSHNLKNPLVRELLNSLIRHSVIHESPDVRSCGIHALGLYCLLGRSVAREYLFLFLKVLENDSKETAALALKVLLDVVMAHGTAALGINSVVDRETLGVPEWEDEEAGKHALVAIVNCLKDPEFRPVAAEGLAKLFFVGTLQCPLVFSRLLVLYLDPDLAANASLLHCLAVFFPSYVFSKRFHDRHQLVVEESVVQALEHAHSTNLERRSRGPAHQIDLAALVRFSSKLLCLPPPTFQVVVDRHDARAVPRVVSALLARVEQHPRLAPVYLPLLAEFALGEAPEEDLRKLGEEAVAVAGKMTKPDARKCLDQFGDALGRLARAGGQAQCHGKAEPATPPKEPRTPRKRAPKEAAANGARLRGAPGECAPEEHAAEAAAPARRVVVAIAGVADMALAASLERAALSVGAELCADSTVFDGTVTHVVRPRGKITPKIVLAAVAGCWLVGPEWLTESAARGALLDEAEFGTRPHSARMLQGARVLVDERYLADPRVGMDFYRMAVETLGGGSVLPLSGTIGTGAADFVVAPDEVPGVHAGPWALGGWPTACVGSAPHAPRLPVAAGGARGPVVAAQRGLVPQPPQQGLALAQQQQQAQQAPSRARAFSAPADVDDDNAEETAPGMMQHFAPKPSRRFSTEVGQQSQPGNGGGPQGQNQSLYKTELCRSFAETGTCRYGSKCQFAHGKEELRQVSRHPRYKTEICKTFHTIGTCRYGTRCRFIHMKPDEYEQYQQQQALQGAAQQQQQGQQQAQQVQQTVPQQTQSLSPRPMMSSPPMMIAQSVSSPMMALSSSPAAYSGSPFAMSPLMPQQAMQYHGHQTLSGSPSLSGTVDWRADSLMSPPGMMPAALPGMPPPLPMPIPIGSQSPSLASSPDHPMSAPPRRSRLAVFRDLTTA
eukprot:m51a1_g12224 putative zinc finger (1315) ;mRNA; r:50828-56876